MTRRKCTKTIDDVINAINANLPHLEFGEEYTLENLTGSEFWSHLSKGERTGLGIEFKAHAKATGVPVLWVGSTPTHKQLYQLT